MAFRRSLHPPPRPPSAILTGRMVGLGMNFAADPIPDANIEDTLVHASELGMLEGDLRVLGVLVQWLEQHHAHVNADRIVRVVPLLEAPRIRAFWSTLPSWLPGDRRFSRLASAYDGLRIDLLPVGTGFQVERRGEDPRFVETPLLVPAGTLRRRPADVMTPTELARQHAGYRNRIHMGPSWRADVWTILEQEPDLPVAEVARRAYCAFATAWGAKRDFDLLRAAS